MANEAFIWKSKTKNGHKVIVSVWWVPSMFCNGYSVTKIVDGKAYKLLSGGLYAQSCYLAGNAFAEYRRNQQATVAHT